MSRRKEDIVFHVNERSKLSRVVKGPIEGRERVAVKEQTFAIALSLDRAGRPGGIMSQTASLAGST